MVAQLKVDLKCNEILRIGQDEFSINCAGPDCLGRGFNDLRWRSANHL